MKLNSNLQLATFFISMLMLSACGGGGGGGSTAPVTTPTTMPPVTSLSLDGSWSTSCQASTGIDDYDQRDIFNFKGNKLTLNKIFYVRDTNAPQTCKHSEVGFKIRIEADISLGATVNPGTATGHTKINIKRTKVLLVPMNDTITGLFNDPNYTSNDSHYYGFGLNGWKIFLWKDISSQERAIQAFSIGNSGPNIFQISEAQIDGATHKVLTMGSYLGNIDGDARPLELAKKITATKQNKTIQQAGQTAQAAGLTGTWKYGCRNAKGDPGQYQNSTINFTGNKLTTLINFYLIDTYQDGRDKTTQCSAVQLLYKVESEADIVVGKVINPGQATEHTQIGIKTTNVKLQIATNSDVFADHYKSTFNKSNFYNTRETVLYNGYGLRDWKINVQKDISSAPDAITNLNIGTQVPDIFKISTVTGGRKELKMGDYQGSFDINGRAMSLEAKGAVLQ